MSTHTTEEKPKKIYKKSRKSTKTKVSTKFDWFKSSAAATAVATVAIAVAFALIVAPIFIPEIFAGSVRRSVQTSVSKFQLNDEINGGLYRNSARSGDTRASAEAAFMGTTLTPDAEISPSLKSMASELAKTSNIKNLFYALSILKPATADQKTYVKSIRSLREPSSGFRPDLDRSATIESTYYALEALKQLDSLAAFKEMPEVVEFVQNLKDDNSSGFRNSPSEPVTLESTFYAVEILSQQESQLEGVASFVLSCQRQDGGFLNFPVTSLADFVAPSDTVDTIRALQVLNRIGAASGAAYTRGNNYLRACLTNDGVLSSYGKKDVSLKGAYYFTKLIESFPSFSYGISRAIQNFFPAVGVLVLLYGGFVFYREQLNDEITNPIFSDLLTTLFFLVGGAVLSSFMPRLAVLVYMALGLFVASRFFRVVMFEPASPDLITLVMTQSAVFLIGIFGILSFSPLIFTTIPGLAAVAGWTAFSFFAVSVFSGYVVVKKTRPAAFIQSAYVSWVINTIVVMSLVSTGDPSNNIFRIVQISGQFPLIFISLPIVLQVLSIAGAALGLVYRA